MVGHRYVFSEGLVQDGARLDEEAVARQQHKEERDRRGSGSNHNRKSEERLQRYAQPMRHSGRHRSVLMPGGAARTAVTAMLPDPVTVSKIFAVVLLKCKLSLAQRRKEQQLAKYGTPDHPHH